MKPQLAIKQDDTYINVVVSTGCPYSGWETSLSALRHLGLKETGDNTTQWHDGLFGKTGITECLQLNQALKPDHDQIEKLMALLSDEAEVPLLWADSRSLWLLDFWAATFPQARFLLFYTRAENALANALRQGADPEQFIDTWYTANRQLMHFQRRNRGRSLLLDAEAATRHPEALTDACQRIGLMLQAANLSPTLVPATPALELLLASQFLREQPAVQELEMELEASAQPLGVTPAYEIPKPIEVYHSYRQWQTRIEQLTEARDEQVRLADERQGRIQQLSKALDEQSKLATDRQAQLTQAGQRQEKLASANQEREQENELLLLQLHQVQEELESIFLQKQQIEQDQKEQDTKLKQLQQELGETGRQFHAEEKARKELAGEQQKLRNQIEQLTSARDKQKQLAEEGNGQVQQLTKALEEQAKLVTERQSQLAQTKQTQEKLESANKETEQENELLLLQLHQVQEELEHYFLKYQELTQELEEEPQVESSDSGENQETEKSIPAKPRKAIVSIPVLPKPFWRMSKEQKREKNLVHLLKESGLFDEAWYLAEYPDVAEAGVDPVEHYLRYGAAEERNPSPKFNTAFYLASNPDIANAEINPLVHYLRYGKEEGRLPSNQGVTA